MRGEIRLVSAFRNYCQQCTTFQESMEKSLFWTYEILMIIFKEMVVWVSFLKNNEKNLKSQRSIWFVPSSRGLCFQAQKKESIGWGGGLPHLLICWASPFLFSDYSCAAQYGSHLPHAAINQLNVAGLNWDVLQVKNIHLIWKTDLKITWNISLGLKNWLCIKMIYFRLHCTKIYFLNQFYSFVFTS